jgi:peroxiredoxin Q/BCP
MKRLQPGDIAPDFTLLDQDGNSVSLSDFRGSKLLLYFYPRARTPGCTAQSCAVRDARPQFEAKGVRAVGISRDPPRTQRRFADEEGLDFPLLSDPDHVVGDAYGVWGEKSRYGRTYMGIIRSYFLIDEDGKILQANYGISPKETVPEAMKALAG